MRLPRTLLWAFLGVDEMMVFSSPILSPQAACVQKGGRGIFDIGKKRRPSHGLERRIPWPWEHRCVAACPVVPASPALRPPVRSASMDLHRRPCSSRPDSSPLRIRSCASRNAQPRVVNVTNLQYYSILPSPYNSRALIALALAAIMSGVHECHDILKTTPRRKSKSKNQPVEKFESSGKKTNQ